VIHGQPLNRGGDDDDNKDETGISSIPKTGKAARPARDDGMEPEPAG
jgi:hypothetical protein